jgi:8-oxo-dGTP pyrophosphatase MutT (NUDIX family)
MAKKPVFKNKPNPEHKVGNKTFWESRSVAVVGVIIAFDGNDHYVLVEKRSKTMMDEPGKWCLPCGYLDWNETGWEALIREVFEETSLYLPDHTKVIEDNNQEPFFVNTDPKENRQNIALSYCTVIFFKDGLPQEPLKYANSEIEQILWVPIENLDKYEFAFQHNKRVEMALDYFVPFSNI